ncbi:MAG: hypothetical protein QM783_14525 [Phycisphaerales bacterium]
MQCDTRGFCPAFLAGKSNTDRASLAPDANASTVVEQLLRSTGLLGGATQAPTGSVTWGAGTGGLECWLIGSDAPKSPDNAPQRLDNHPDLPKGWSFAGASAKDPRGVELIIDLNALRTDAETLFDAPWLQHLLDRLSLNNARLVTLRATLNPPTADGLPPLLELKALTSALRRERQGKAAHPHRAGVGRHARRSRGRKRRQLGRVDPR